MNTILYANTNALPAKMNVALSANIIMKSKLNNYSVFKGFCIDEDKEIIMSHSGQDRSHIVKFLGYFRVGLDPRKQLVVEEEKNLIEEKNTPALFWIDTVVKDEEEPLSSFCPTNDALVVSAKVITMNSYKALHGMFLCKVVIVMNLDSEFMFYSLDGTTKTNPLRHQSDQPWIAETHAVVSNILTVDSTGKISLTKGPTLTTIDVGCGSHKDIRRNSSSNHNQELQKFASQRGLVSWL